MDICGCTFWLIIILLIVAGVAYLLGADTLGEMALDIIRLIIILLIVIVLLALLLLIIGYIQLGDVLSPVILSLMG